MIERIHVRSDSNRLRDAKLTIDKIELIQFTDSKDILIRLLQKQSRSRLINH